MNKLEKFADTAADLIAEAYRQEFSVMLDELELEALREWLKKHFNPDA